MTSVQVRILSGSASGSRLRVDRASVSFGRSPDCDITIDQSFVSREHGKLTLTPKGWVLENLSPNGTVVGGRKVTRKPRAITAGQVVSIGDQDVFELVTLSEAAAPAAADQPAAAAVEKKRLTGRAKLWIGIGAYMFLMLVLFVFFSTMERSGTNQSVIDQLPAMGIDQIRTQVSEQIRATLPKQPPDTRLAREHSERALRFYNQRSTDPQAWINALREYQLALSYTPGPQLADIEHDKRFIEVQQQLIDEITTRYNRAYGLLRNRSFDRADDEFRELSRIYHAPGTPLFEEIQNKWNITRAELGRRRR